MGSIPAILDILVKLTPFSPKRKTAKKFPSKIFFKNFKKKFLKFSLKSKKNQYWLKKNKWKYFFSDSNQWFSLKKKIKSNAVLFVKQKRLTSFFYYEKNILKTLKQLNHITVQFFNIFFKIQILRNRHCAQFLLYIVKMQILFYLTPDVRKNLILFSHFYYFFNKSSFLFSLNKIENFKLINFKNLTQSWKKNEFKQSLKNPLLADRYHFFPSNSRLINSIKTPYFYCKRGEQRFFINFKVVKLFYRKNRYGFFWLASIDRFSANCLKASLQSLNLNKFFLLNRRNTRSPLQKFLYQRMYTLLTDKNVPFLQNALGVKTFLTNGSRYSHHTYQPLSLTKNKNLRSYFYTYQSRLSQKIYPLCENQVNNKRLFFAIPRQDKSSLTIFQKASNSLKNFNFFFKKIVPLISNLEFFFLNELVVYNFKFLIAEYAILNKTQTVIPSYSFINFYLNNFFFYSKTAKSRVFTNLFANTESFSFVFKKFLIKTFSTDKLSIDENPLHYDAICRFLEFCSGKKIHAVFNPFMANMLNFEEKTRCLLWSQKIKSFRKVLGPRLFLNESLQIIYFCLKNKDVYVLASWMLQMFYKISFWKYKLFFRYLQYVLRYFFWSIFEPLRITGLKFQMKGKISVAGNARTRTVLTKIGTAGHSSFKNRILYDLKLIRTFTGVIGFKTWIFF